MSSCQDFLMPAAEGAAVGMDPTFATPSLSKLRNVTVNEAKGMKPTSYSFSH